MKKQYEAPEIKDLILEEYQANAGSSLRPVGPGGNGDVED